MAEEQDDSQKTEEPTRKRIEEAEKKGQIAFSREIGSFFLLFGFTVMLFTLGPMLFEKTRVLIQIFIERPDTIPIDEDNLLTLLSELYRESLMILAIPFLIFFLIALGAGFSQNKFIISTSPITPDLEKISPMKGLKRLFSMRSVTEFLKGLIKIVVVTCVTAYVVIPDMPHIKQLPDSEIVSTIYFTFDVIRKMLIGIIITMFFIAMLDFFYQRYEYLHGLRMSKQEIKDEYKQMEGDPHVKSRIRSIRMERARQRMMSNVPKADVVITNPTHYAVALKYDAKEMKAPKLIAKGLDNIALKIREVARDNNIPIVENPPLARVLYESTELDKEIPFEHYKAVAEVIGYIYRLKGKKGLN
jgi:flagellar biosynthetic protein FlhB